MNNKNLETTENKKVSGNKKTKMYLLVLVVGIGLIVGSLYYKNNKSSNITAADKDSDALEINVEDKKEDTAKNYLEGVLNNSDNLSRGNLKLISKEGEIYLRTSRDFSRLVGLQVLVLINGTLNKFELLDMQSKIESEGYLLPQ